MKQKNLIDRNKSTCVYLSGSLHFFRGTALKGKRTAGNPRVGAGSAPAVRMRVFVARLDHVWGLPLSEQAMAGREALGIRFRET